MEADEFVKLWKAEMDSSLNLYKDDSAKSLVTSIVKKMHLSPEQERLFWHAAETILNDTYYTLLLGLDGSAQIGGNQETYKIYGEDGKLISGCGDIEAAAWEYFNDGT